MTKIIELKIMFVTSFNEVNFFFLKFGEFLV